MTARSLRPAPLVPTGESYETTVHVLDPVAGTWDFAAPLAGPVGRAAACSTDGHVYLFTGEGTTVLEEDGARTDMLTRVVGNTLRAGTVSGPTTRSGMGLPHAAVPSPWPTRVRAQPTSAKTVCVGGKWCKRRFVKFPDAADFNKRFEQLLTAAKAADNEACVECHGCTACSRSTFCRDSAHLTGCHYCVRSRFCTDCSHCRDSTRLVACHHCVESEECTACRYVTRSRGLSNCTYCFGCVGLSGKDFHILNEPYSRKEYFELVEHLSRVLRATR